MQDSAKYKRVTEQLLEHVRHTKFSEAELTLLLVAVGQEREVVSWLQMLTDNSLQDSECRRGSILDLLIQYVQKLTSLNFPKTINFRD